MSGRYDDIINLPHHQSTKHPHMSMTDRAAQFSPFAALTGYGAVITETGRLTEERIELTEEQKDEIDRKLNELRGSTISTTSKPKQSAMASTVRRGGPDRMRSNGRTHTSRIRRSSGVVRRRQEQQLRRMTARYVHCYEDGLFPDVGTSETVLRVGHPV